MASHAAYIRVHLDYYNGHTCGIYGVASSRGDALIYPDPKPNHENAGCVLTMRHVGKSFTIDDGGGSCSSYCGARGTFSVVKLPYESKRPIRYLPRLKQWSEYRGCAREWRTGKPVQDQLDLWILKTSALGGTLPSAMPRKKGPGPSGAGPFSTIFRRELRRWFPWNASAGSSRRDLVR